ncbi:MAG: phage capsid protein [Rhizobiaceae bacterium]
MSIQNWYKEFIKDKVTSKFQAMGGYLDGTMQTGDVQANLVKFPISGRMEITELFGAIEPVETNTVDLTTVQVTMRDFEGAAYWRTQDAYKAGPKEQDALAKMLAAGQRRRRDTLKLDALATFQAVNANVQTVGTGVETPDIKTYLEQAAVIRSTGAEGRIWAAIPEMAWLQLMFYKEFANSQWVPDADKVFKAGQLPRFKTVHDVTFARLPDEYFKSPAGQPAQLYHWMWHEDSMGAELPFNVENVEMERQFGMKGSPYLVKNNLSGCAIGVLPEGVKRLNFAKIATVTRPPA